MQPIGGQGWQIHGDEEGPTIRVAAMRPLKPRRHTGQGAEIRTNIPQEGNACGCRGKGRPVFWTRRDGDVSESRLFEQSDLSKKQGLSFDLDPGLVATHSGGSTSGENHASKLFGGDRHVAQEFPVEPTLSLSDAKEPIACLRKRGSERCSLPRGRGTGFPPRMSQLENQVAVVTGAGRGIGRAIALRFAQAGADVVVVSRTVENSEKTAAEIRASGRKAWALAVDVSDPAAIAAAAETLLAQAGRVDILVNNAGVTKDGLLMRMSESDWDTVLNTNLRGAFLFTKALTRTFLKQRSGRIINLASVIGLIGNAGQANYAASKAGLIGFTKSVAKEFGSRGVTCNAIAPGFIETDMTAALNEAQKEAILKQIPLGSLGQASDIAEAALYLAGPGGRYVTGQVLTVDGGMVM